MLYNIPQDPARASEAAVEETSTPETLTAAQVSIIITIVTNVTNEVLSNSQVAIVHVTIGDPIAIINFPLYSPYKG